MSELKQGPIGTNRSKDLDEPIIDRENFIVGNIPVERIEAEKLALFEKLTTWDKKWWQRLLVPIAISAPGTVAVNYYIFNKEITPMLVADTVISASIVSIAFLKIADKINKIYERRKLKP